MADVYGDVAGFKAYWTARGQALLVASDDDDINASLLIASDWIDQSFVGQFGGLKIGQRDQIREWPRMGAIDISGYSVGNSIPREVLNATYEAAARQITTPGVFFKDYTPSKYKSVSISGAIAVEYAVGSAYDFQTQLPQIAAILAPILTGGGNGSFSALSGRATRV